MLLIQRTSSFRFLFSRKPQITLTLRSISKITFFQKKIFFKLIFWIKLQIMLFLRFKCIQSRYLSFIYEKVQIPNHVIIVQLLLQENL